MIEEKYQKWLTKVTDEELLIQLRNMSEKEKEDCFFKDLSFGTGGMRGILGAGSANLNIYTVDKATQGISNYLTERDAKCAVVCYDSRINSHLFACNVAAVFATNGITAYITDDVMPVSFLSYAVRSLNADIGVMITASHNPAEYNGYKVYGADGCQCTDYSASVFAEYISKVDEFSVQRQDFSLLLSNGSINYVSEKVRKDYLLEIEKLSFFPCDKLRAVYSPLCGAGYKILPEILRSNGAEIFIVSEQASPNGNFPTCPFPNPERKETLALAVKLAKDKGIPLVFATDPDCDRVGLAVLHDGQFVFLTGNEIGALLCDFVLSYKGGENCVIFKTIVTSDLGKKIAESYGAHTLEVLTGFKYIGEQIGLLEKNNSVEKFVLGYEESYGYLLTDAFRDKDGVGSCYVICQMVAYYASKGMSLVERLNQLYERYGYYSHDLASYRFQGASGSKKIIDIMSKLRSHSVVDFAGLAVVKSVDFLTQSEFALPKADVLTYYLEGDSKVIIRPSGTEPLVKVYFTTVGKKNNATVMYKLKREVDKLING